MSSPVEDVATAIAASVRANGWQAYADHLIVTIRANNRLLAQIWCDDFQQAERLADMMTKPVEPVFEAMGFGPMPTIPSIRSAK